jgi:hypothetical protein
VKLRFIDRLAKFTNLEGFDFDNPQYGEAVKPNASFTGGPTTITVSSKLNTMNDDDDGFAAPMDDGAPF